MSDTVLYEAVDGVALITLNRPNRLNAWNAELGTAYFDALDRAIADGAVKAIVVTGAGKGWCAGADMDLLQGIGSGAQSTTPETRTATYPMELSKPVIAAVNGACAGLGLVAAAACDIRFAAAGAKFTTAFSRRGLIAEYGSAWILPRLVGQANAMDLLLSGRVVLAEEAQELGLVNKVVAPDELVDYAVDYAKELATKVSPTSMSIMKQQVYGYLEQGFDQALDDSVERMKRSLRRPDFKEGVASYLEKRDPAFGPVLDDV